MCSKSERFHSHPENTLWSFGFQQKKIDNYFWVWNYHANNLCTYIYTHVEHFMVFYRNPEKATREIKYLSLEKYSSKGETDYYIVSYYKCIKGSALNWLK